MRLPLTPSGLTIDRVRSSAISLRPLLCQWFGAGSIHGRRIAPVLWGSREVYLGSLECGNVSGRGSARKLRVFGGPDARRRGRSHANAERMRSRSGTSDRETLPAAALALDVRVAEGKGLVQPLLHEVHDRAVDEREARGIDEHPHATVFEHRIAGLRAVGVVDHVGKAGAAGFSHTEPQADTVPTSCQESLDPKGCGFRQRNCHRSSYSSASGPGLEARTQSIFDNEQPAEFLDRDGAPLRPARR